MCIQPFGHTLSSAAAFSLAAAVALPAASEAFFKKFMVAGVCCRAAALTALIFNLWTIFGSGDSYGGGAPNRGGAEGSVLKRLAGAASSRTARAPDQIVFCVSANSCQSLGGATRPKFLKLRILIY